MQDSEGAQKGQTFGSAWMHRALIAMLRHVDIRVFYAVMAVFAVPPTLLFSAGARLTFRYYHTVVGYGRWKSLVATFRNSVAFGKTVIDKFAMYAGHRFRVAYVGEDDYKRLTGQAAPLIQLSAHIGCSEIVGYSYDNLKPANVLVYGGEKEELMAYRKKAFGNKNIKMIPVATGDEHSEDIVSALDKGEIVCAFADRFWNPVRHMTGELHGRKVKLARGPFALAVTRGLDVVMASAMKERDGSYTAFFTPLHYDRTQAPRQQREQLAAGYTAEIERLLERYPLQWFNYSDLWEKQ